MALVSGRWSLGRAKMLEFLGSLASEPGEKVLSVYLPPFLPAADIEGLISEIPAPPDILARLLELAGASRTGAVILWSPDLRYLILPPFPISEKLLAEILTTEPLVAVLRRDYLFALVLVRLGAFAVGVCKGEKLLNSKVGTGLVHGRHRQGGSSAQRFARHRDKQIEVFLTRVCQHTRQQLEPHVKELDYIVFGGARNTLALLHKRCPFLSKLYKPALPHLLDIPAPRQAVLEASINRVWASTVIDWREY
ncbi:MAG: Vms1/Ankzf1 family peptidyl-tRNA hydrolase [Chloroflexota bacterium]